MQTAIFPILGHSLIFESGSGSDPVLSSMVFHKQINEKGPQIGSAYWRAYVIYIKKPEENLPSVNIHIC